MKQRNFSVYDMTSWTSLLLCCVKGKYLPSSWLWETEQTGKWAWPKSSHTDPRDSST